MKVEIDLNICVLGDISLEEYCILTELHLTNTYTAAIYSNNIIEQCINKNYILSTNPYIISSDILQKLGLKAKFINAIEFIDIFPNKVPDGTGGFRPLRPINHDSITYKTLSEQYLAEIKNIENHITVCKNAKVYVEQEVEKNGGMYIPSLTNIIKENKWDYWDGLTFSPIKKDIYNSI